MMRKNVCSPARVIIIALLIFPAFIITSVKAQTISKEQRLRIKSHKESKTKKLGLFKPRTYKLYNTKKSITKKLYSTSIENYFINRLRTLPFTKPREFNIQEMRVRKDIDYKILSMRVRKDINYKILNLTP